MNQMRERERIEKEREGKRERERERRRGEEGKCSEVCYQSQCPIIVMVSTNSRLLTIYHNPVFLETCRPPALQG